MLQHNFDRSKNIGAFGEAIALDHIQADGNNARYARTRKSGDLHLIGNAGELIKLEIKTAKADITGKFQFCLSRKLEGRTCTDFTHADYVILQCVNKHGRVTQWLVIPVADIEPTQKSIKISNPASGKWSKYIVQNLGKWATNVSR